MKFENRIIDLQKAYEARKLGIYLNSTPFRTLPSLGNFLGGIPKGVCIGLTADANVGKTPLAKNIAYNFYLAKKENPKINYQLIYFCLEEPREKFIDRLITHFYYIKYGKYLDYPKLLSNSKNILSEQEWKEIDGIKIKVNNFLKYVTIIDDVYDPDTMYDICLEHLSNNGRLVTEIKNNVRDIKSFVPHKLDSHICVITDHCNDLTGDKFGKGETFYAIEKWCRNYSARNLSKKANVTCFQVLQQALDKTQYTSKGKVVV